MSAINAPIRFALLTYGKIARLHAQSFKSLDGCELVAVWGRSKEKRDAFAADFGLKAYGDIAEMIRDSRVDAVIVASPHPQHKEQTIAALEAGAHAIVEKPMAITAEDCDAMISSAKKAGKKLGVISQRRFYPSVRRIRDAIDAGKIGEPALGQVNILGWRDEEYYKSDPWRGSWEAEGGGVLVNQAIHQLDIFQWLMGPIAEVSGYWSNLNHPYIEVEDTAVASVKFKSGALGSILVSNSQKPGIYAKVHVHGRNGASTGVQTDGGAMFIAGRSGVAEPPYNDIWTVPGEEKLLGAWKAEDEAFFKSIDPTIYFHGLQFADFADAIRNDRTLAVDGAEGKKAVALFQAIYRSSKDGKAIRL